MSTQRKGASFAKARVTVSGAKKSDSSKITLAASEKKKKKIPAELRAEKLKEEKLKLKSGWAKSFFAQRKKIIESGHHLPALLKPTNIQETKIRHPFPVNIDSVNTASIID